MKQPSANNYYQDLEKESIDCPICCGGRHQKLYCGDRYGMGICTVGCQHCGMIFVNPRPTQEAMLDFYQNHYRSFYESVARPTEEYVNAGPFKPRANYVVNVLGSVLSQDDCKSLLDIGCAEGTLLRSLKNEFPRLSSFGLEPDPNFAEYTRLHSKPDEVFTSDFHSFFDSNTRKFNIITLSHVLEHILDPIRVLSKIREIMPPDGYLYVEVPNIADERTKGLGHIHIGHVLSFSPATLQHALKIAGFTVAKFFAGDLPAKTPAMAALCQPGLAIRPTKQNASATRKSFQRYQESVCGIAPQKSWFRRLAG